MGRVISQADDTGGGVNRGARTLNDSSSVHNNTARLFECGTISNYSVGWILIGLLVPGLLLCKRRDSDLYRDQGRSYFQHN